MLSLFVATQVALVSLVRRTAFRLVGPPSTPDRPGERGQATAEYALVLLGAAAVALMLAAWAAKSGKLTQLFDAVVGQLIDKAG
ncbi:hypothetical protein BH10ACT1_BH10ACT1_32360 [soil metagenome]